MAANNRHTVVTELLLIHGASVNTKDTYGWTALDYVRNGKPEIANLLRSYGAK
ncbi:MAG: ankyrin repeat domain-containing protein [Synergistaceae bacterium]|nr:ankyrin repeat domain-containing protein [Synergistaceae bacterium]